MQSWTDNRSLREAIRGHDNNYTLLRAILAASVIYYHSFALTLDARHIDHIDAFLQPVTSLGSLAVQAFFFLSGLFVAQSYFNDRNTVRFVLRRAFRVWPGLFVCLVITAFIACAISSPRDFFLFPLFSDVYEYILRNAFFDTTWYIPGVFEKHALAGINGPIHTLPLEIRMYAILAIAAAIGLLATRFRIAVTSVVLMLACFTVSERLPGVSHILLAPYSRMAAAMFFAGVLAFAASEWIYPRLWQGLLLAGLTAVTAGTVHQFMFYCVVAWVLLYLGQSPIMAKFGRPRQDLSYGIYIYGWPSQQFVIAATSTNINPYALALSSLLLASVFAALSWHIVEKPAIALGQLLPSLFKAWRRRLTEKERRAVGVGAVIASVFVICVSMSVVTSAWDFVTVEPLKAQIIDFGPKEEKKGVPFNTQADGTSAIWIKLDATPPEGTKLVLAGHKLETSIGPNVASGKIDSKLLNKAGNKELFLEYRQVNKIERSNSVALKITN